MLKIIINDQQADLEGVKFNLQLNSPIPFVPEDGLVEGSFAFGVVFPATPVNKLIFGFPHRLELYPEPSNDFSGYLYFNGRMMFEIIVTLTDASDYSFKANIKVNLGLYSSLIGDKSLRDLVYDGEVAIGSSMTEVVAHANAVVAQSYPETSYNFPEHYNPKFYGEERKMNLSWSIQNLVNNYIHGTGFRENSIDNDNEVHNYYNLVPMPYLFKVLSHCFSEFGYKIGGPVLADQELASLLIYNNYALDLMEDRYKSHVELSLDQEIPVEGAQINFDHVLLNIDGCYDSVLYKYQITKSGDHQISFHLSVKSVNETPNPTAHVQCTVFYWVGENSYVGASGELYDPDFEGEIDGNAIIKVEAADVGKYIYLTIFFVVPSVPFDIPTRGTVYAESWLEVRNVTWSNFNQYARTINLANHVPDIKISAFLVALQKAFGVVYHFNHSTREVDLLFLRDILGSTEEDVYTELSVKSTKLAGFRVPKFYKLNFAWSSQDEFTKDNFIPYDESKVIGTYGSLDELPTISGEGDVAIVLNLNAAYRWETEAWVRLTDLFYTLDLGSGITTAVSLECSPLMMHADYTNPYSSLVCPKVSQEGSSIHLGMKEFGFHLLFYRGMKADSFGNTYPFASCTKYGPTGDVIGNYEFNLDSDYGIYKVFLEAYYNFVINRSRPVEYDRHFSASDIREIDFIRKKRIFQHVFLLDELSIPISNTSIGVANMKLQKI